MKSPLPLILLFLVGAIGVHAQTSDQYYGRLGRSMETFGAVFREITTEYVDQTDPEVVIEAGIRGMLAELDPYSEYTVGSENESVSRLSTGSYVGFGFSLAKRADAVMIVDVRVGQPAANAGLRRGDRLVAVDGVAIDTATMDSVRKLTRGTEGTTATFSVVRYGRADTFTVTATRARVPVENITHVERLPGNIGYVRMTSFSRSAGRDMRDALDRLVYGGPLSGLILDLRGNPGGLLESAVDVAQIFLPKGAMIVTTRDRLGAIREYASTVDPLFPTLPLAVVVNERSASASEVLAGAIQDHDRGVIVGTQTFGKGLVQTVRSLPFDATLKLTTARYYTPSGRCPQRRIRVDSFLIRTGPFTSRNGRNMVTGEGIIPELLVTEEMFPPAIQELYSNWVFADYATRLTSRKDSMPEPLTIGPTLMNGLYGFVDSLPADRQGTALEALQRSIDHADSTGVGAAARKAMVQARTALRKDLQSALKTHADLVMQLLEAEVASRWLTEDELFRRLLPYDPAVGSAADVLSNGRYRSVLSGDSAEDQ